MNKRNPIIQTFANRNWEQVFVTEDYDPSDREERHNVRKFVTMDGEIYVFVRKPNPWHLRLWYDFRAWAGL